MQKTNFKTRLLALLTAVFMVIVCVPFAAFADNAYTVSFFDVETKTAVGDTYTIKSDTTVNKVNVSSTDGGKTLVIEDGTNEAQTIEAPDGYKVKVLGGHSLDNGKLVLDVVKIGSETKPQTGFTVSFFDVENNVAVGDTYTTKVDATDNKVNVSSTDGGKTLVIEDGTHDAQTIYAPDGYKVKDLGGYFITDGKLVLDVVKIGSETKPQTGFTVSFFDVENNVAVGDTYTTKVDATDNKVNVSSTDGGKTLVIEDGTHEAQTIYAPDGYKVKDLGGYFITDGKLVLDVVKIGSETKPQTGFTISFFDVENNVAVGDTYTTKVDATDNKVNVSSTDGGKTLVIEDGTHEAQTIYAPDGYKVKDLGGYFITDGKLVLDVVKIETKPTTKFYVMFKDGETISGLKYGFKYDPEDGKVNISSKDNGVNLTIDEGTSHQQTFKAPEGYRVTKLGGFFVEDGKVILNIEKIPTQKSVALNYILDGKTVGTTTLMVNADATKIEIRNNDGVVTANGQKITAPEGYVFCNFGDFFIEQDKDGVNYVNLSIAAGTKEITLTYYVEGTDKNETVGTEKHTVATNATKVEVREVNGKFTADGVAITAPNGYKLVVSGDFFIENNNVNLKVVKVESKNNSSSSSSTSSSSSNKTTTASNQKQVVKAAAAPANTTKVLPKTGASNVAPLLGGSLAVVALLMGYGVYGLVLRKKD